MKRIEQGNEGGGDGMFLRTNRLISVGLISLLCLIVTASLAGAAPFSNVYEFDNAYNGWTAADNATNGWTFATNQTPSANVGPSGFKSGSHYIYTEASSPTADDEWTLSSPTIDATTYDATLNFWYNKYHNTYTTCNLQVQVSPNNGSTWDTAIWTSNVDQGLGGAGGTVWLNQSVDLSAYDGNIKVRFNVTSGGNWQCDTALDKVTISGVDACTSSTGPPTINSSVKASGNPISVCDVFDTAGSTLTNISIDDGGPNLYDGVSCTDINTNLWGTTVGFEPYNIDITAEDNCGATQVTSSTFQYNSCMPTTGPIEVTSGGILSGTSTDVNDVITANGATLTNIKVYEILGVGADIDEWENFDIGGLEGWGATWTATEADGSTPQSSPSGNGDLATGFFTRSDNTGPTAAYAGDFIYYEASTGASTDRYLVNNSVYDAGNNELKILFKYLLNGADVGTLAMEVSQNSGAWTQVWSDSGNKGDTWKTGSVDLNGDGYTSGNIEIRFRFTYGGGTLGDIALDAINIVGPRSVNPVALFDGTSAAAQNASTASWPDAEVRVDVIGTDDCGGDLSDWGFVNFLSDATAPVMSNFLLPANSLSPVSVYNMFATDNNAVSGYLVTETPAAPSASDPGWTTEAPITVATGNTGVLTFYGWAKDAARNISTSLTQVVSVAPDVTAPTVTAFVLPAAAFSPLSVNLFTATDDSGAVTGYMITESATAPAHGAGGWLSDPPAQISTASTGSTTFYAWVKDSANVSTSLTAVVDVKEDTAKPTVSFVLPATHNSFVIPITTFLAGDTTGGSSNNTGVSAYMVTTTSTPPAAGAAGWTSAPPATVSVTAEGAHNFWGWAKDNADNVSVAVTDSVTVTLPVACVFEVDMGGTLVQTENYTSMGAPNPWAWDTILTPLADNSVQSALNDGSGDLSSGGYIVTATGGTGSTPNGSRADYPLFFTTSGTYCIWIRGLDQSGTGGGDSNFWGVDGTYVGAMTQSVDNQWAWTNGTQNGAKCTYISGAAIEEYPASSGTWGEWHTINLWPREQGQKNDMFMLTSSTSATGGGKFSGNNDQVTVLPSGVVTIDPTCVDQAGGGAPGGGAGATGYVLIDDGQSIIGSPINVEALYSTDLTNPLEYRTLGAESDGFEHFVVDPKWRHTNIGNDALDPDAVEQAEGQGVLKLTGSGADIWGNNDYFMFHYQADVSGDFSIDVNVQKLVDRQTGTGTNQNASAKAGIMVRQSLATNSRNVMMQVTDGVGARLQRRASDGGTTAYVNGSNAVVPDPDTWLRLTRSGSTFEGFYSTDNGNNWTSAGTTNVTMTGTLVIGLGVTSHNTARDSVASFDNFMFMPNGPSSMIEAWTGTGTDIDATLPTAWIEQDYALAVRDPAVASGSAYQVNSFAYNDCVDLTPSTLTIQNASVIGATVSLNSLFDYTGNPTGFAYEINGNSVLNPWNSYSEVPAGIKASVTLKVTASDLDCGGSTLSATGVISVDNENPDATPSTITILTGQVTGGANVDLTGMFTSTGNVAVGGFTYKIEHVSIGNPTDWDSRLYGNQAAEKVSLEVRGIDPDTGNIIVGVNDITIDNTCVRNAPSISFSVDEGHVGEGRALPYAVTIRNEDSYNCGPSTFDIAASDTNSTDFDASYFNPVGSNLSLLLNGRDTAVVELAVPAKASAAEWNSNVTTLEITSSFAGVHHTPKTSGAVTTKVFLVSPITHNSVTTNSTKWSSSWGTSEAGSKYGNFDCLVCHEKGGPNIKWMLGEINLSGATWGTGTTAADLPITFKDAREGPASPANDGETNDWGDDDPDGNDAGEIAFPLGASGGPGRTSSTRTCEVCHSQTLYHRYDTSGQTELAHFNGRDCTDCHRHSLGFTAGCQGCHGNPPLESSIGGPNGLADIPGITGSVTPGTHYKHVEVLSYPCEYCHNGWREVGEMPKEVGGLYQINHKFNVFFDQGVTDPVMNAGYYTGQDGVNYEVVPDEVTAGRQNADGTIPAGKGTLTCENIYCHGGTDNMSGTNPQWNGNITCNACHGTSATDTPPGYSHSTHVGKMGQECWYCHGNSPEPGSNGHVNGQVKWDMAELYNSFPVATQGKYGQPKYQSGEMIGNATAHSMSGVSNTDGTDLPPSAAYGTCTNVACHFGVETPVWNSGEPATCSTCHNDASESRLDFQTPTLNATYNALATDAEKAEWIMQRAAPATGNHQQHVKPSAADNGIHQRMIGTYLNMCENCHGGGANSGEHAGHIDFATSVGGGMTYDGSTCTSVCHDARYITWGSAQPLSCEACHMAPYLGPTVVDPDNEGTGLPTSGYGSHLQATNADVISGSTDWSVQCSKCHPYHDGGVTIPLPTSDWTAATGTSSPLNGSDMQYRLGLQYPVSQGIHLGGTSTTATTEAEICWECHGADDTINEWGYNTDTNDIGGTYPATVVADINAVSQGSHNYGWLYTDSGWTTGTSAWIKADGSGNYRKDGYLHEAATSYILSRRIVSVHSADFNQTLTQGSSVNNNVDGSGVLTTTNTNEVPGDIRCSYCHDVHDLNRAVFDLATGQTEVFSGPPYLRNSWMGNPYAPDAPPSSSMETTGYYPTTGAAYSGHNAGQRFYSSSGKTAGKAVPRLWPNVSLQRLGGFFIDQNADHPMTKGTATTTDDLTLAETAGICTMCHGSDVDGMDYYSSSMWRSGQPNGHSNSTIGGTGSNKRNIFDARRGSGTGFFMSAQDGVNYLEYGDRVNHGGGMRIKDDGPWRINFDRAARNSAAASPPRNTGWYGGTIGSTTRGGEYSVWYSGNTTMTTTTSIGSAGVTSRAHDFSCSKCHSPHATGLPALLITNCLDVKAATWGVTSNDGTLGPTTTTTKTNDVMTNCHYKENTTTGWHRLAPDQ